MNGIPLSRRALLLAALAAPLARAAEAPAPATFTSGLDRP